LYIPNPTTNPQKDGVVRENDGNPHLMLEKNHCFSEIARNSWNHVKSP